MSNNIGKYVFFQNLEVTYVDFTENIKKFGLF